MTASTFQAAPSVCIAPHLTMAVWLLCLTGLFVGLVALSLPFLQRWLDETARRRRTAADCITGVNHARHALRLISAWQEELAATADNPINLGRRHWVFEFQVAARALTNALGLDIGDPDLRRQMIAALAWSEMAADFTALAPAAALRRLQCCAASRTAADAELSRELWHFMLILGAPALPHLGAPARRARASTVL